MKPILFALALLFVLPSGANETTPISTFYFIRHAEKSLDGSADPALTETGHARAARWAEILQHVDLAAVYSTDTERTRDTAAPIAALQQLSVSLYEPTITGVQAIRDQHRGQSVLLVGHSNTNPRLVNHLTGTSAYQDLDESDYSTLFIVNLTGDASGSIELQIK